MPLTRDSVHFVLFLSNSHGDDVTFCLSSLQAAEVQSLRAQLEAVEENVTKLKVRFLNLKQLRRKNRPLKRQNYQIRIVWKFHQWISLGTGM